MTKKIDSQEQNLLDNIEAIFMVIIFALMGLSVVSQLYIPIPMLALLGSNYGTSPHEAALVLTVFGFAYATGFLIFGPLSDHFGRHNIMLYGMIGLAAMTVLVARSHDFQSLLTARILQGFVAASFPPVALAYLTESLSQNWRMFGLASMSFAFLSAAILAQVFTIAIGGHTLAKAEYISSGVYVVAAIGLYVLSRKHKRVIHKEAGLLKTLRKLPGLLIMRDIFPFYIVTATVLSVFVAFYALLGGPAAYLLDTMHMNGLMIRLVALPGIGLAFMSPHIAKKLGTHGALNAGFIMIATAMLGASYCAYKEVAIGVLAASVLLSAGVAIVVPVLIGAIGGTVAPQSRGSAVALYTFVLFCGASLGPQLAASFISFKLPTAFFVLGILPALSVVILQLSTSGKPATGQAK